MCTGRANKIILCPVLFFFIFYLSIHPLSTIYRFNVLEPNHSNTQVRIYCIILTSPQFFNTRARAVNSTWAKRCDRYSFISESSNETLGLPVAPLANITPGYWHLTQKTTLGLHYVYENFANDYDWVFKGDDDTYLFVENLRSFLKEQNTSEPITFGYNFRIKVPRGFHAGGAGYVLSREATKRFYEAHRNPNTTCVKDGGPEDVEIAKCLRTVGVYPGKSLDEHNHERFHHLSFKDHFHGQFANWFLEYAENKPLAGLDCCSNSTISFHYMTPDEQYLIEQVRYGIRGKK